MAAYTLGWGWEKTLVVKIADLMHQNWINTNNDRTCFFSVIFNHPVIFFSTSKILICIGYRSKGGNDKESSDTNSLVWFSSQLSWRSTYVLSSDTSWHHQRMMSARHDDRHRSGWSHDRHGTTRLLYTAQHSYCCSCHYPDLWLWTVDHHDQKANPLLSLYQNARIGLCFTRDRGQWKSFFTSLLLTRVQVNKSKKKSK